MGTIEAVRERRRKRIGDKRAFPTARNAGHHGERAEVYLEIDIFKIVLGSAGELDGSPARAPALCGDRDDATAAQVIARHAPLDSGDPIGRAFGHEIASVLARTRTHIDDVVGGADRILVVLHYDDSVAEVAQALERGDETVVIALMKSDGGFVQDIQDAHEAGSDLGGEPDALRFAAGKRGCAALERQVVEPHIDEELEARFDFLDDRGGYD